MPTSIANLVSQETVLLSKTPGRSHIVIKLGEVGKALSTEISITWQKFPTTIIRSKVWSPLGTAVQTKESKAKKEVKMGFIFSKSMNENMKSQQEFMLMNSRLQLERQLIMQNEMRERQMAMQIAWSREFLKYFGTFFGITAISLTAGAIKGKKPVLILPMVPLGFVLAYQYDMGYGTLIHRMKGEAENILETEKSKLQLPKGVITFESLEKARREQSKFFIDK
ncbi:plasminogen receptor (KT) isoform X1 [Odocoileus virginianus]|uniref:Plasminogen receptor (KT) isoform X1 n=2 Tax=Odocoileus virginianus TaxID=9874 RepID=A0A6J0YP35_ODOVR|nr:plasminogen receptor (KT) isoform X1 [Odocoileus virginianus texanus]